MASRKGGGVTRQPQQIVRDPEVRIGRLRLLQRTDGVWIACDASRAPGDWTVRSSRDRAVVERWMRAQAEREAKEEEEANGKGFV